MLDTVKTWVQTNKTEIVRVGAVVIGAAVAVAIGLAVANASGNEEMAEGLPTETMPTEE